MSGTLILGAPVATVGQARAWAAAGAARNGAHYWQATVVELVDTYYQVGAEEGVRADVALAQSAKETGFWSYAGAVRSEQWNLAGIGATGGGVPGESWPTLADGVRGHIRRLRIYATPAGRVRAEGIYDLTVLKRPLPETYWGIAPTVEALGGRWAPSPAYGQSIVWTYLTPLLATLDPGPHQDVLGHWAEAAIRRAVAAGVMIGDGTTWRPDDPLTRAELAVVLEHLGLL